MRRITSLGVASLALAVSLGADGQSPATQPVPKGAMPTLGRPTDPTDAVPTLDFESYFVGKWTFEWSLPDSPLSPAGTVTGTTIVTKVDGAFYEAVTEGDGPTGPFKVKEVLAYHRDAKTLARQVNDSRGFVYLQSGDVGGDLGGIFNIRLESAPFVAQGKTVRLRTVLRLLSPLNYRVAVSLSVEGGPFTNLGNPWWRKDLSYTGKP